MYSWEFFNNLAIETGACCAAFAAGADCAHSMAGYADEWDLIEPTMDDPIDGRPLPPLDLEDAWIDAWAGNPDNSVDYDSVDGRPLSPWS